MGVNPFLCTDGYKIAHHKMYPEGTTLVYSNFTPRSNKYGPKGCNEVVSFGQQFVVRYIKELFDEHFFLKGMRDVFEKSNSPTIKLKNKVCQEIKKEYSLYLGTDYDVSHIEELWDLGYLPIEVKALPEGTTVPMGVPVLTIWNTDPKFYWLTNFLETLISNLLWKPMTSATIAHQYRKNLTKWALKTDENSVSFVDFQGHDFSMRGMDSPLATMTSGLGHAVSFLGSDSLPVIHAARKYYDAEDGVVHSVNATEHSVMCAGSKDDEIGTFRYLMKQFPTGILSVVSDTWDLWRVLTEYLPKLKEEILERDGKLVIRPDSGNPVDIICGTVIYDTKGDYEIAKSHENELIERTVQAKGVIELLWDTFGGTINDQGYKVLNPKIGAIYGDSITLDRAEQICQRLEAKGFATTNIVLGIGSFTYQYNTRDTFGFAMKATYVEVDGEGREIFKDPITDDGTKKSAKGLLKVARQYEQYTLIDQVDWRQEDQGYLQTIFREGHFFNKINLQQIRNKLKDERTNL